jgi:DNA-binding response OmpR family regulator
MARILSVSYDEALLHTRRLLLEARGYSATSAFGLKEGLYHCKRGGFDLFILSHSMPKADKELLIHEFRASCPAPIISLCLVSEPEAEGADYYIEPDPKSLLELIAKILGVAKARSA